YFAQLEKIPRQQFRPQRQCQQRAQQNECQLERITAQEPSRRFELEADFTEVWNENDEQFQCAGVAFFRYTIQQRGLLLPSYSNTPKLVGVFMELHSLVALRHFSRQDHRLQESNIGVLAGTSTRRFDRLERAINPQREFQSQRGQFGREGGRSLSRQTQGQPFRNVFSGFDKRFLAEAFNIDTQLASRLRNEDERERELRFVSPQFSREEAEAMEREESQRERSRYMNGFEATFCSARLKHNLNDPSRADVFNPCAGRIKSVNSFNFPILRFLQLSARKGFLYRNAMLAPNWNINAHSLHYVIRGSGRVQIVSDNGQSVFDQEVRPGQVFTTPQNFATVTRAGSEGLEWVSFQTNDNAQWNQLAGRVSAIRAIPEDVLANAFQISREDARRVKFNRDEIEQVTGHYGRQQRQQRQQRSQQNECQLDRINSLEPARRFDSEAGTTEIWDENDEQFRCAGRGFHGAAFPGCPETFQSSGPQFSRERRESSADQHQKVRQIREGDFVALPAGVADWFYNNADSPLVLVQLLDTSNPANQLDQDFRKFFLAGNPQQELQSQRSQYERGQEFQRRQQQGRYRNVFAGFDKRFLAEAFNIDTRLASRLRNEDDRRGIIVRTDRELRFVSPQFSREEERERGEYYNGIEETFCTARLKHNVNDPSRADVFNPRAGRLTTVNSFNLPLLRFLQLSGQRGVLYRNAIVAPHWSINAHSIYYITRGSGRVQIVSDNGQAVFDGEVREGQVFTAPQNFAVAKRAGNGGLEFVAFKTNDNAQVSQLAGRVSTFRAIPEDVLANAYQISREEARRLKFNRDEVTLFSSSESRF
ncbi:hypothetical protein Tsubulata_001678, partial [Turnera subulata]